MMPKALLPHFLRSGTVLKPWRRAIDWGLELGQRGAKKGWVTINKSWNQEAAVLVFIHLSNEQ